jgi:hypothetical protein
MISKIGPAQPLPPPEAAAPVQADQPSQGAGKAPAGQAAKPAATPAPAAPPVEESEPLLRLEIKDDGQGRYVYTLTDRNTGRTVVEIPRETLAHLAADESYSAGDVVRTKV